jgi:O-glycosyl hydrolase
MTRTRRTSLELSAWGFAAAAVPGKIRSPEAEHASQMSKPPSAIPACGTSDKKRFASAPIAEISRSGQFWPLAHYSRVIQRGATRFDSPCAGTELEHVAFENPDGTQALILTNAGSARKVDRAQANFATTVPLKANSVTTLAWSIKA